MSDSYLSTDEAAKLNFHRYREAAMMEAFSPPQQDMATDTGMIHLNGPSTAFPNVCGVVTTFCLGSFNMEIAFLYLQQFIFILKECVCHSKLEES